MTVGAEALGPTRRTAAPPAAAAGPTPTAGDPPAGPAAGRRPGTHG
ncbi:hypothetical protein [Micromonospora sp. NPDC050200]